MSVYQKCIPHEYHASIFEIPYQKLKETGIKSLFFDLDNTIIAYDETRLNEAHLDFFKKLGTDFKIVVISNSNYKRVSTAVKDANVPFVWHALKPFKFGLKKALKLVNTIVEETIVIGDQLMTDIYGASRMGIKSILVASVKRKSDRKITQFNRKLEKIVLRKIEQKLPDLYEDRLKAYVNEQ